MSLDLVTILPNINHSLEGTGFLFGAGTSVEAGYPMMNGLTRKVVGALTPAERAVLDKVLKAAGSSYDDAKATPNIEEIADLLIAHAINSKDAQCIALEPRFRELVVHEILAVKTPNIDNHVQFFRALSKRTFGRPCTVWIFTTNYDLLFEVAAAKAGVLIENGFSGCTERFFNPGQFMATSGEVVGNRFTPNNQLAIKLVKLHGSISWTSDAGQFFERHPDVLSGPANRVMVLPRRKKVMEALAPPHETMFAYMSRVLGGACKYILCCGFSFGDEHINQHLVLPALKTGRIRLFTLNQIEPSGVADFKKLPSFGGGYSNEVFMGGKAATPGTDLWKFSEFVKLF
ncbi:MAG: SIR2 family protein [Verrucomicrobiae bacterium]|nr:SIR2 family protein [Verrucomicrobiae bacterium]